MKQREVTYIQIAEQRTYYFHMGNGEQIELTRTACVQDLTNGRSDCRIYKNISEASILRLAKIQEKLAK